MEFLVKRKHIAIPKNQRCAEHCNQKPFLLYLMSRTVQQAHVLSWDPTPLGHICAQRNIFHEALSPWVDIAPFAEKLAAFQL